ncbi:MAG: Superoxide dismutase [Berkelbacteria bacterium GW2011_GWA2_35_9]|uniref:Superoxide dismutase n=1 Tax=Berkelbacteria bacterium GW2011_GWA2_35_9 TaxID=1618333 RepID=A0A0G0FLF7_9BACT|nr:MAG: Superoxide dismutase [Berkelbacteria bacterium GW2011_GWA2_35_9]
MSFILPELGYKFDALEPYIDAKTMEIHYTIHHQAYVDKLNEALTNHHDLIKNPVENLIRDLNNIPGAVRKQVQNFGGGHYNHSIWWKMLKVNDGEKPTGKLLKTIDKSFGSFDDFKQAFGGSATKLFGSGWVWLVKSNNGLEIVATQNQDNPLSMGQMPILGIDIWEHAYYLKYQNRRADYIEAFWKVVNWGKVSENLVNYI